MRKLIGLIAVLAMVMAACATDDGPAPTGASAQPDPTVADTTPDTTGDAPDAPATTEADGEPLIIGYAAALSGFAANADQAGLAGVETMVELLNREGGIAGHPVELVVKDMQSDPALSATVTQELLDAGAHVILGPVFPGMGAGVIQTATVQNGIPVISVENTGPEWTVVGGAPSFLAAFGDNAQAAAVAEYLYEQGHRTAVYMTSPDLNYTSANAEWFAEAFEHLGGEILGSETFSVEQGDFSPQVTAIANLPTQPDVIYASMFMPDNGTFQNQLRAAGVTSVVAGGDGYHNDAFIEFAGEAAEGTVFSTHGFPSAGNRLEAFGTDVEEVTGNPPPNPGLTGLGGDAVLIIQAAVEAAGSIDPAAIMEAISGLSDIEVTTGSVTFAGTNGVPIKTVAIGVVENGEFVFGDAFVPSYVPSFDGTGQ